MLQQHLPFTVLKLQFIATSNKNITAKLQQHLLLTVLKLIKLNAFSLLLFNCCNSSYRLRYAQKGARQQRSKATMRSAHLKYLNEVKVKRG